MPRGGSHIAARGTARARHAFTRDRGRLPVKVPSDGLPIRYPSSYLHTPLMFWYQAGAILAFAPVDRTNRAGVDAAMAAFHGAYAGVDLTGDADSLFARHQPWTTAAGQQPDPQDGHCVVKVAADGSGLDTWVTWGATQQSTLAWTAACLRETWVIITQEDTGAANLDITALRAEIGALHGMGGTCKAVGQQS